MAKCPHCDKEINYLKVACSQDGDGNATIIEKVDGEPELNISIDEVSGTRYEEFYCPECLEFICNDVDIAKKLLLGEATPEDF